MSQPTEGNSLDFGTIVIVGVGLIGGSIALAARQRGAARSVIGVGRDPGRLQESQRRGIIDEGIVDLAAAARRADLLVFCTPVNRIVAGVREAAGACRRGTLITDVGSVKECLCRELASGLANGVEFVGSHPLAGSEKRGFEHAQPDLLGGRVCLVTPVKTNSASAIDRICAFWTRLGSTVIKMSPEAHDRALAETSHLPHVAAAALAGTLSQDNGAFAASGFRDTTRIASGDPGLWTAILLGNRNRLLESLARYDRALADFREALEKNDAPALKHLLEAAKVNREKAMETKN